MEPHPGGLNTGDAMSKSAFLFWVTSVLTRQSLRAKSNRLKKNYGPQSFFQSYSIALLNCFS